LINYIKTKLKYQRETFSLIQLTNICAGTFGLSDIDATL